jgi:hypothetical protein
MSFGFQGVALMLLAERIKDATTAETAYVQIEAALESVRASGHPVARYFAARLSDARLIRDSLMAP